jgi:dihydrofolate reductase
MGKTHFYTGKLQELVSRLKAEEGKDIFIDGGAEIVNELLQEKLIDELIISIIPILLGDGTRLFKDGRPEQRLQLVSANQFDTGLLQIHYKQAEDLNTSKSAV